MAPKDWIKPRNSWITVARQPWKKPGPTCAKRWSSAMTHPAEPPPPAGWYQDPERPEAVRWWDGRGWTDLRASPDTPDHLANAEGSAQEDAVANDPAADAVLRCDTCNQRRHSRVEVCKNCGRTTAAVDPDIPNDGGVHYPTDDVLDVPKTLDSLLEMKVALAQEKAILDGAGSPPSAALLRPMVQQEADNRALMLKADLAQESVLSGPYSTGKWEANPFGLSGRVIRGYRHWRRKR
jgi:uncharacterized protein DUF2510